MTQSTDGLVQVIDAMKTQLASVFPGVTIGVYDPKSVDPIVVPAILIDLVAMPLESDNHDKMAIRAHWCLHCLLADNTPDLSIAIRTLALSVMENIKNDGVWLPESGVTEQPQKVLSRPSDVSYSGASNVAAWEVQFQQRLHLGASHWDSSAIVPQNIYVACVKEGEPHAKSDHELIHTL